MEVIRRRFAAFYGLVGNMARAVEHFLERAIRTYLDAEVMVRNVVRRKCQAVLHRGLNLHTTTVGTGGVVVLGLTLVEFEIVVRLNENFAEITNEAPIKSELLRRGLSLQLFDYSEEL